MFIESGDDELVMSFTWPLYTCGQVVVKRSYGIMSDYKSSRISLQEVISALDKLTDLI